MKKIFFLALAISSMLATSCKKDKNDWKSGDTGPIGIHFDNRWGDHDFVIGQEETTPNGEKLTPSKMKYYISNVVFNNADGSKYVVPQDESYFLIDGNDPETEELEFENVPAGNYESVTFTLGVDSLRNTKDISERTGVLDITAAAKDMYWDANSGYIFYNLEGTSPASTKAGNAILYHLGGFGGSTTPTFNNLKTITITADHSDSEHQDAEVRIDRAPEFHLYVDASKLFAGETAVKISEHPSVELEPFCVHVCHNFPGMFSLDHVHND